MTIPAAARANQPFHRERRARLATAGLVLALAVTALTGCGGGNSSTPPAGAGGTGNPQVLPVASNPITNTATAQALTITKVLTENNIDETTGKDAADHLEVGLRNTGPAPLAGFELYYTLTDTSTHRAENYYLRLPADFTIPAGGTRTAHIDGRGGTNHFPVNKYSLYYQSKHALTIAVTVSATGAAVATTTVGKDSGGAENPGE